MNGYLICILVIIVIGFLVEAAVSLLNLRALDPALPAEFSGVFDPERYTRSQEYTRATTRLALVRDAVTTVLTVTFLLLGGFNRADAIARSFGLGSIATGKYVDVLLPLLGDRLLFPRSFAGIGDMSRGSLMLRAAQSGVELEYATLDAPRHGGRKASATAPVGAA